MSIALAILGKAWPYLLAATIASAGSVWLTRKADSVSYAHLQAAFSSYQTQVADANAAAEKTAREALQAQIDDRHRADINNAQVMDELKKRAADAVSHYDADRALIRGLLNAASQAPTPGPGGAVPKADDRPGSAGAGAQDGVEQVAQLCAATKAEDQWNADRLDAVLTELKPQL